MNKKHITIATLAVMLFGCVTDPYTGESKFSSTAAGGLLGAAGGAAVGALVSKDKAKGAIIGAAAGGLAGGGIGAYMDSQDIELRKELQGSGVSVTKNADKAITLNMPGDITFKSSSSDIIGNFVPVLDSVAKVLKKYDKTVIRVMGHTDSTGTITSNNILSEDRANAVASYLAAKGVARKRFTIEGYGPSKPVADNGTSAGRAQNRRVEIKLVSSD